MMAGNPSWWSMFMNGDNMNSLSISDHHNISSLPSNPFHQSDQDFSLIRPWTQLLMGGGGGGGEEHEQLRFDHDANLFHQQKKFENWGEEVLNLNNIPSFTTTNNPEGGHYSNSYGNVNDILNFSAANKTVGQWKRNRQQHNNDHSYELKSNGIGGASKKARVQHDHELSPQPVFKVRKEKVMMDRVTALHQLVSPFGKTDTASVLSEAIVSIRFLQAQIESFSSPYMRNASGMVHHQYSDSQCLEVKDLQSRGLCLVPVSNCTQHVHIDNGGVDCWGPAAFSRGF